MRIYAAAVPANGELSVYIKVIEDDRVREYVNDMLIQDLRPGDYGYEDVRDARYDDIPETAHIRGYEFEVPA